MYDDKIKQEIKCDDVITIDTKKYSVSKEEFDIFKSRSDISDLLYETKSPIVSIVVTAYNRIEKTKLCVESIIKYTADIDCELLLVDNGSCDKTLEYFKSVIFKRKKIIQITKNLNLFFAIIKATKYCSGKYIALMANDIIVTQNWMTNILKCFESDKKIGMVCPMSSNVSNYQDAGMKFSTIDEMQQKASKFNISDPQKWHERLRLITLGAVYKSECIDICGNWDYGFHHEFADDDFSFHIRRAGYKLMLCKDVFVHHNHNLSEEKVPEEFNKSMENGRLKFINKYFGIDPCHDVFNYEFQLTDMMRIPKDKKEIKLLGIDVRCGAPLLEAKNKFREYGYYDAKLYGFTEEAKYYVDLCTICDSNVECDRVEHISEYYEQSQFDCILLGKPLNFYSEPMKLLTDILFVLKKDGQLLLKFKNTYDIESFFHMISKKSITNKVYPVHWSVDDFNNWIDKLGYSIKDAKVDRYNINNKGMDFLNSILKYNDNSDDVSAAINKMIINEYSFNIG